MDKEKAYQAFIEHTRNWLFDLPDSEILLPLLELRFTPEEAAFLSIFPHLPHTKDQLSERLGLSAEELEKIQLSTLNPIISP